MPLPCSCLLQLKKFASSHRCNFDERQRSSWVRIAHQGSQRGRVVVVGLHLDVPVQECIRRAQARDDHPTLNGTSIVDVIQRLVTVSLLLCVKTCQCSHSSCGLHDNHHHRTFPPVLRLCGTSLVLPCSLEKLHLLSDASIITLTVMMSYTSMLHMSLLQ